MRIKNRVHFHWYVTTSCNSKCRTCSIWSDPAFNSKESSLSSRLALLPQIKKLGFVSIDFTGGEPLLYKGLPILIREAKKMGFFTTLTTNGTLYLKYAEELRGNLSQLSFSLDGPTKETHEYVRRIPCFKSLMKSIIKARELGELVMLKSTITNYNFKFLPEMINLAQRLGVLIELNPEFSYFDNPRLKRQIITRLFKYWKHPNVIISNAHLRFMLDGGNFITNPICPVGKSVFVLSPNNELFYPCMHHVQDVIPIKNNGKDDLITAINSAEVKLKYQMAGSFYFCENCTIPCYFEAYYYSELTKYFPICMVSRLGYLKKRFILKHKLSSKSHKG